MLFNEMPNYVKMHGRCVTLATSRSPEACLSCAAQWRAMKYAGGVAGNNSGTAGFTYCPAGAPDGR